jgi:hypothetical protein
VPFTSFAEKEFTSFAEKEKVPDESRPPAWFALNETRRRD